MGKKYRDNYYLDAQEAGVLENDYMIMEKSVGNLVFGLIRIIAYLVVSVFYFSMDLDIGDILGGLINSLQKVFQGSIFKPLFTLAFAGTYFLLIKK